jgi:hypothetical protein
LSIVLGIPTHEISKPFPVFFETISLVLRDISWVMACMPLCVPSPPRK